VYRRDETLVTRVIADETLLVPVRGTLASLRQIFALNPVAAFAWERIDGSSSVETIVSDVVGHFDVERDRARSDLEELFGSLSAAGLIHEVGKGPEAATQP
jgi:hypothetical protein